MFSLSWILPCGERVGLLPLVTFGSEVPDRFRCVLAKIYSRDEACLVSACVVRTLCRRRRGKPRLYYRFSPERSRMAPKIWIRLVFVQLGSSAASLHALALSIWNLDRMNGLIGGEFLKRGDVRAPHLFPARQ